MKYLIINVLLGGIALLSAALASGQTCTATQSVVLAYGNGLRTDQDHATGELLYLQEKLQPYGVTSSNVAFCLVYEGSYIASVASTFGPAGVPITPLLQFLQGEEQIDLQAPESFWYWLSNRSFAPPQFNQIEQDLGVAIGVGISAALQPDIFNQLTIYQTALFANHQGVVVVAYSQGNLYLNQVYSLLFPSLSSPGIGQFKAIAVATPADQVAGGGPYTTLTRDPIYLLVDAATNTPALSPNTDNGCLGQVCGVNIVFHDFKSSYLDGSVSGPRILNQIVSALSHLPGLVIASNDDGVPSVPFGLIIQFSPNVTANISSVQFYGGVLPGDGSVTDSFQLYKGDVTTTGIYTPVDCQPTHKTFSQWGLPEGMTAADRPLGTILMDGWHGTQCEVQVGQTYFITGFQGQYMWAGGYAGATTLETELYYVIR